MHDLVCSHTVSFHGCRNACAVPAPQVQTSQAHVPGPLRVGPVHRHRPPKEPRSTLSEVAWRNRNEWSLSNTFKASWWLTYTTYDSYARSGFVTQRWASAHECAIPRMSSAPRRKTLRSSGRQKRRSRCVTGAIWGRRAPRGRTVLGVTMRIYRFVCVLGFMYLIFYTHSAVTVCVWGYCLNGKLLVAIPFMS